MTRRRRRRRAVGSDCRFLSVFLSIYGVKVFCWLLVLSVVSMAAAWLLQVDDPSFLPWV